MDRGFIVEGSPLHEDILRHITTLIPESLSFHMILRLVCRFCEDLLGERVKHFILTSPDDDFVGRSEMCNTCVDRGKMTLFNAMSCEGCSVRYRFDLSMMKYSMENRMMEGWHIMEGDREVTLPIRRIFMLILRKLASTEASSLQALYIMKMLTPLEVSMLRLVSCHIMKRNKLLGEMLSSTSSPSPDDHQRLETLIIGILSMLDTLAPEDTCEYPSPQRVLFITDRPGRVAVHTQNVR